MLVPSFFFSLFLSGGSENDVAWTLGTTVTTLGTGVGFIVLGTGVGAFMALEVGTVAFIAFGTGAIEVFGFETGGGFMALGTTDTVGTVGTVIVAWVISPIPSVLLARFCVQLGSYVCCV